VFCLQNKVTSRLFW